MKLRLHEIELGTGNPTQSKTFYADTLGMELKLDQPGLHVFDPGSPGVDFNTSTHLAPGKACYSFITDNLDEVINRLKQNDIVFEGPKASHLAMVCIEFSDPDGNIVKVNTPTAGSPEWLRG